MGSRPIAPSLSPSFEPTLTLRCPLGGRIVCCLFAIVLLIWFGTMDVDGCKKHAMLLSRRESWAMVAVCVRKLAISNLGPANSQVLGARFTDAVMTLHLISPAAVSLALRWVCDMQGRPLLLRPMLHPCLPQKTGGNNARQV